jgi:hypothetical protein
MDDDAVIAKEELRSTGALLRALRRPEEVLAEPERWAREAPTDALSLLSEEFVKGGSHLWLAAPFGLLRAAPIIFERLHELVPG